METLKHVYTSVWDKVNARNAFLVTLLISAAVHGMLISEHLHESLALGLSFLAATIGLVVVFGLVYMFPNSFVPLLLGSFLFISMIVAYFLLVFIGIPPFSHEAEGMSLLGNITKIVEFAGLYFAAHTYWAIQDEPRKSNHLERTTLLQPFTICLWIFAAVFFTVHMNMHMH